ncbi:MAG: hypothetical protein ABH864_04220 [archaeon]
MEKRGISHIEVILAFVIFIAAVGFGLYFFNTGDSDRVVDATLTYAFREIEGNTTTSVEVYSVDLNKTSILPGTSVIALNFSGVEGMSQAVNYSGNRLNSSRGGSDGELVFVFSEDWANEEFLFVMFGEEFYDDSVSAVEHNETYYRIGSSEVRKLISEKRFVELNDSYYSNYGELKKQENFNIPDRADFGFSLVFEEGDAIVAEREIPDGFEVFSERKRVEVLRTNNEVVFADLIVKVW